jgi:hypothetical protein
MPIIAITLRNQLPCFIPHAVVESIYMDYGRWSAFFLRLVLCPRDCQCDAVLVYSARPLTEHCNTVINCKIHPYGV